MFLTRMGCHASLSGGTGMSVLSTHPFCLARERTLLMALSLNFGELYPDRKEGGKEGGRKEGIGERENNVIILCM